MNTKVRICEHLEGLLPQMDAGRSPARASQEAIERAPLGFYDELHPKFSLDEFKTFLRNYGFVDEWDVELLVAAYFFREHQSEIAREYGVSQGTVSNRLKHLRKLLVERGIEQELY